MYRVAQKESHYEESSSNRIENRQAKMLQVCIKYSMCDLICDVISCCVGSCDIGKINVYDKVMTKNLRKRENKVIKEMFT